MTWPVLAAPKQETASRYTMPRMTASETTSHVAHRPKLVSRPDQLFTEDALNSSTPPRAAIRAVKESTAHS